MQTVLGSNGQIGHELVQELYKSYTKKLRLVSRNPQRIHETDEIVSANLLNIEETKQAITGSEIVYFTVGLPMNSEMWENQFIKMLENVISACEENNCKLVFFDNTYMYKKDASIQYENSPFEPTGRKSNVRAKMATLVEKAMNHSDLDLLIARAPEFYGPNKTQSITNTMIFNRIKAGKKPLIPLNDKVLRTLIWTPDASRAVALLGNTEEAYNQTWHLPCDAPISYQNLIAICEAVLNKKINYTVIPFWQFKIASIFNHQVKELLELLPRYQQDNIFNSDKFKKAFPDFEVTTYKSGIKKILL